jgi:hypothetical protein
VTPYGLVMFTDDSEECGAFIFRAENFLIPGDSIFIAIAVRTSNLTFSLHSSPNIVTPMKYVKARWVDIYMVKMKITNTISVRNLDISRPFRRHGSMDERIIIKFILKKQVVCGLNSTDS